MIITKIQFANPGCRGRPPISSAMSETVLHFTAIGQQWLESGLLLSWYHTDFLQRWVWQVLVVDWVRPHKYSCALIPGTTNTVLHGQRTWQDLENVITMTLLYFWDYPKIMIFLPFHLSPNRPNIAFPVLLPIHGLYFQTIIAYIHMYTYMYVSIFVHIYIFVHICTCIHIYIYMMYVCACIFI